MTVAGIIFGFFIFIWTIVTLILVSMYSSMYAFLQSSAFVIVCIVYVITIVAYSIFKKIIRRFEDEW